MTFLAEVLAAEVDDRPNDAGRVDLGGAKFPRIKRLADFDVDAVPGISAGTLGHLAAGGYLDAGEPVVLLGDSCTGKSHLLIGLGLAACEQGRRVRYITCAQLVGRTRRGRRRTDPPPAWSPATGASICCCSTNSATSNRPPWSGNAVPDHHRTGGTGEYRDRIESAVLESALVRANVCEVAPKCHGFGSRSGSTWSAR
ncbi:ATP-binding protein [Rhodococcus jostii]|uniref:ATP-binding protein n=1 Tax=Rhodococcus jostii TaxID=132919 RepID=UPI00364050C2